MHEGTIQLSRRQILAGLTASLAGTISGCSSQPADILRLGLRVDVQTPHDRHSGYGIVESAISSGMVFTGGGGVELRTKGEAVPVDLPGNQVLFALLRGARGTDSGTYFGQVAGRAIAAGAKPVPPLPAAYSLGEWQEERQMLRTKRPSLVLPVSEYPLLGRFRDLADPTTFEVVDPANLAASFGPGFVLDQIVLSVTDQPPTSGIETRLGWLPNTYQYVKQTSFGPNQIPGGDFQGLFTTKFA